MDVTRECLLYHETMTSVYLADSQNEERHALRLMLVDLNLEVVGEAADWPTTLAQVPVVNPEMLLVDWDLLPVDLGVQSLVKLRLACRNAIIVILISHLDARHQAALSAGADTFISKGETPERVAERLRAIAASVPVNPSALALGLVKPTHDAASSTGANRSIFK
jgi:DNA-binding NarL/FixJ family response regulator